MPATHFWTAFPPFLVLKRSCCQATKRCRRSDRRSQERRRRPGSFRVLQDFSLLLGREQLRGADAPTGTGAAIRHSSGMYPKSLTGGLEEEATDDGILDGKPSSPSAGDLLQSDWNSLPAGRSAFADLSSCLLPDSTTSQTTGRPSIHLLTLIRGNRMPPRDGGDTFPKWKWPLVTTTNLNSF